LSCIAQVSLICLLALQGVCQTEQAQTQRQSNQVESSQVENVTCQTDPTQSYTLFLPSTYTPAKRWPIIYFFDPGGHGNRPIELYAGIAEKYGFVIVGSNNSRNFGSDTSKSMTAIWQDTHLRFALDEHRTYTSGFSGGARVAGAMAMSCLPCQIVGVIANGAGYPSNHAAAKDKGGDKLLYFFAVGDEDFNWPEVMAIRREREDGGLPYRVRVFSGRHQWAPPAVMEEAIEWFVLKSIQAGDLPPSPAFVDRFFQQTQNEAVEAAKRNDAIAELSAERSVVADFSGLKDTAEAGKEIARLKKSAALKAALKHEQQQIVEQSALEGEITSKLDAFVNGSVPDPDALRTEIVQAMGRLSDQVTHSKKEETRLVSKRAFGSVWVGGIETGERELEDRHFEKAEACFQLMSQVNDDPWPVLLLADTHAAEGKRKQAIRDLDEAVKRGLNDAEVIESDAKLQSLKQEAEFQTLLQKLKHK
jgi:predicted esterase